MTRLNVTVSTSTIVLTTRRTYVRYCNHLDCVVKGLNLPEHQVGIHTVTVDSLKGVMSTIRSLVINENTSTI